MLRTGRRERNRKQVYLVKQHEERCAGGYNEFSAANLTSPMPRNRYSRTTQIAWQIAESFEPNTQRGTCHWPTRSLNTATTSKLMPILPGYADILTSCAEMERLSAEDTNISTIKSV